MNGRLIFSLEGGAPSPPFPVDFERMGERKKSMTGRFACRLSSGTHHCAAGANRRLTIEEVRIAKGILNRSNRRKQSCLLWFQLSVLSVASCSNRIDFRILRFAIR